MVGGILDTFPEYAKTSRLDELRESEYSYLDAQNHVYLDYTGSGLAAKAQHRAHDSRLASTLFGNPHSVNPTSEAATSAVEHTRARILSHLNASADEYVVVFTANATNAARLVAEAYPFTKKKLVLTADNHNSINGIREFARTAGAKTTYVPVEGQDLRVDNAALLGALGPAKNTHSFQEGLTSFFASCLGSSRRSKKSQKQKKKGLFAYPAQSNFAGVRHPLSWVSLAQERGYDVLLDAAAYLPTSMLDLSVVKPEFVIASWYKLFGYPTGVGCLIAKREALDRLVRPWFSGGTIKAVTVGMQWHQKAPGVEGFEDGTVNFQSIPDVGVGLDWITGSSVGMGLIETRVKCLTGWFLQRLQELRHSDGSPMVVLYGPKDTKMRGGSVAFNFLDAAGKVVDERLVAYESTAAMISLRTGCFCNPGAAEGAFGLTPETLSSMKGARTTTLDEYISLIGLPSAGAIRVSFGVASNTADVDRFFGFAEKTYKDRVTFTDGLPARDGC
ncbi:pyridoxal phosphate-dependent transferase [Apodospora peruviana]|uniref:Pyridoxal phosphate-dependent transferase n=1 Tax=Apodospora peruviana TaxID=516989 RepID=A0AAE0MBK8_9PEZI|nr:pyridoxal phosphate-dependent transferase [Apodospora peruviana]